MLHLLVTLHDLLRGVQLLPVEIKHTLQRIRDPVPAPPCTPAHLPDFRVRQEIVKQRKRGLPGSFRCQYGVFLGRGEGEVYLLSLLRFHDSNLA